MAAKSKSQQRFYGMVHAVQQGKLNPSKVSSGVRHAAENTKPGAVKEIASTKHTGLVEKIAMNNYINKYGSVASIRKAINMAVKRGSVTKGTAEGMIGVSPVALFTGATLTTMPAHLQKGSLPAAAAIMGLGGAVGAISRTGIETTKILQRAKRLKSV